MGDADTQIQASVVITSDTTGAKRATNALNEVNAAGGKAAEGTKAAGASARVSTEDFTRMARTATAARGSMEGIGALVGQVAARIGGMAAALPVIGLLVAAFQSWRTAILAVNEAHKAQLESLRMIKVENAAAHIDALAASYSRLTKSLDNAAEAQKLLLDGQQALNEATAKQAKANLDLAEMDETAKEKDPLKQAAIKARYDRSRAGVDATLSGQSEETKMNQLLVQRTLAENKRDAAKEQLKTMGIEFAEVSSLYGTVQQQQDKKMASAFTDSGRQKVLDEYAPKLKDLDEKKQKALLNVQGAREQVDSLDRGIKGMDLQLEAQQVGLGAQATINKVSGRRADAGVTQADTEIERARLQAEADKKSTALEQARKDQEDAGLAMQASDQALAEGHYSQADQINAQRAKESADQMVADLSSALSYLTNRINQLQAVVKNLPTQQ